MPVPTDRKSMVPGRKPDPCKLPRAVGSYTGSSDLPETQNQGISSPEVKQAVAYVNNLGGTVSKELVYR